MLAAPQDENLGTPEFWNATEYSQGATPGGDYSDPITPASQDSYVMVASPNQGLDTTVFANQGRGSPWGHSFPTARRSSTHDMTQSQRF